MIPNGTVIHDNNFCDFVLCDRKWKQIKNNTTYEFSHTNDGSNVFNIVCDLNAPLKYEFPSHPMYNQKNDNENKDKDKNIKNNELQYLPPKRGRPYIFFTYII